MMWLISKLFRAFRFLLWVSCFCTELLLCKWQSKVGAPTPAEPSTWGTRVCVCVLHGRRRALLPALQFTSCRAEPRQKEQFSPKRVGVPRGRDALGFLSPMYLSN